MNRWARSGCADGECRSSFAQTTSARPIGTGYRLRLADRGLQNDPFVVSPAAFSRVTFPHFTGPVSTNYGGLIANERFQPAGFGAPPGEKDIRLTFAAAETLRVPMAPASLVHDRLQTLIARGGEQLDWAAIAQRAANYPGLR